MASLGRITSSFILMLVLLFIVNVAYAQNRPSPQSPSPTGGDVTSAIAPTQSSSSQSSTSSAQNTQTGTSQDPSSQSASQQQSSGPSSSTDNSSPTDSGDPGPTGGNTPSKVSKSVILTTNSAGGIVTITSTSTSYSLQVPTGIPNNKTQTASDNSGTSDSSTNVVTAAIAVGAVVIAAIIGIWIFRKWKLTPSRNFKEKIQPVSFAPRSMESDTVFLRELNEP